MTPFDTAPVKVLPSPATLAERLAGFLAESVLFFLLCKVPREVVGEQGANWPHFESILTLLAASRQTQIGIPRIAGLDYW
jgi:hypothetical protein